MALSQIPLPSTVSGFSRSAIITTSGTWVHPDGASSQSPKPIYIQMTGGGGSGCSGTAIANIGTSGYFILGGMGGASGTVVETYAILTGNLTISIGAGGPQTDIPSTSTSSQSIRTGSTGGTTTVTFPSPFGSLRAEGGNSGSNNGSGGSGQSGRNSPVSGGTASPFGELVQASAGGGVVGSSGLSSGASAGNHDPSNNQNPSGSGAYGQADAGQMTYSVGGSTSSYYPEKQFVKQSSFPAGSGAEGGHNQNSSSSYTRSGGTGGFGGFGTGGNGGASSHVASGSVTATNGSSGTGYGGGGGGGGAASTRTANTATAGRGAAGMPGAVIIYY